MADTISLGSGRTTPSETSTPRLTGAALRADVYNKSFPVRGLFPHSRLRGCTRLVIFNTKSTTIPEAWRELEHILQPDVFKAIVRLESVTNPRYKPRIDMWIAPEMSQYVLREIRAMTRERTPSLVGCLGKIGPGGSRIRARSSWRIAVWQSFWDREPRRGMDVMVRATPFSAIMSCNVNGFHSKRERIVGMLSEERIGIAVLQETLVGLNHYPIRIHGYTSYSVPWQEGFRGTAVLVDDRLSSYKVPHALGNYLTYVRISGLPGLTKPVHLLAAYMPSGGGFRARRTALLEGVFALANGILERDNGAYVLLMGDLNTPADKIDRKVALEGNHLLRMIPVGSDLSRFPVRGRPSALDHIIGSPQAHDAWKCPRILREYDLSDHRPVAASLRVIQHVLEQQPAPRRIDGKMLRQKSKEVVHHNRWALLDIGNLDFETEEQLSTYESLWRRVHDEVLQDQNVLYTGSGSGNEKLPDQLKSLLRKYKRASKRYVRALQKELDAATITQLESRFRLARARFRTARKVWDQKRKQRRFAHIADALLQHDTRTVWGRLRSTTDQTARGNALPPVRNKDGELKVSGADIMYEMTSYYRELAQDNPDNISTDEARWAEMDLGEDLPDLGGINQALAWPEVLLAIRRMNRNTAPGKDGVHINVLKSMVVEECMAELVRQNPDFARADKVMVNLPKDELPIHPLTPMGRAFWTLMNRVWEGGAFPAIWNEVWVCSLLKPGDPDPEILSNYRGISLISVSQKVLMQVMTEHLQEAAERENLIAPEQSGFRRREEAIAQFIVLSEVVRRRHLQGKHTYGVFVDFKKAYDKVCHGALYRVVSHLGIRGKFLEIIKWMYRHSAISVRMGGKTGDPFEMLRGTRQGCPLSPLLFILFINHILKDCSLGGVEVPGSPGTSRAHLNLPLRGKCKGGLYADDLILLEENLLRARGACEKLADWAKKWGMELGLQKCGVMLWSTSEEEIALYSDTEFDTPAGRIPQVDRYKYLGIWVDRSLVNHRSGPGEGEVSGLELQHSKAQAQKGERAVHQMRPLLTDRNCPLALKVDLIRNLIMPLMLYGSEWTAFRQTHAAPLQRVVNMAARWALGVFAKLTSFDGMTMCHALRIPSVEEEMVARRTRLQAKLEHGHPKMRTWLQILWGDDPHSYARARGNPYTWCKSGRTWVNRTLDANEGLTKYAGYRNITRPELAERAWELWEALRGWGDALNLETWHGPEYMSPREKLRDVMPLREWAARALIYESHVRSNDFRSVYIDQVRDLLVGLTPVGMIAEDEPTIEHRLARGLVDVEWHLPDERITWLEDQTGHTKNRSRREQTLVRDIRDCILERQFATMETKSFKWYDQWGFGATRDFTRAALQRPDLAEGVRWLTLVRIRGFPRVREAHQRLLMKGTSPQFTAGRCPLCHQYVSDGWEWCHLLLRCTHRQVVLARTKFLVRPVKVLGRTLEMGILTRRFTEITGLTDETAVDGVVGIYLIGGVVDSHFNYTIHLGFGMLDITSVGLDFHLYIYLASFFQAAAPVFASALFIEDTASVTSEHLEVAPTVDVDTEGEELLPPVFERRQRVLDSEHFARQYVMEILYPEYGGGWEAAFAVSPSPSLREPSLPLDHDEISEDVLMDDEA